VHFGDLRDEHVIVGAATVFKEDGEDLPNVRYNGVAFLGMLKTLLNQLIESNRVNEQCPIHSICSLVRNAVEGQSDSIDLVAGDGVLVFGFQDHAGDVQMLSVFEGFIDPGFEHFRVHLHLLVGRLEASAFDGSLISSFNFTID